MQRTYICALLLCAASCVSIHAMGTGYLDAFKRVPGRVRQVCSDYLQSGKAAVQNNATTLTDVGVASVGVPSAAYVTYYLYNCWYGQLQEEPTAYEQAQLYAAAAGTVASAYYVAYRLDVAPHQLILAGYNACFATD